MIHKILKKDKGEYVLIALSIVLAGALSGLGSYLGNRQTLPSTINARTFNQTGTQTTPPSPQQATTQKIENIDPVNTADHIRGSSSAKVFLIEYSDPECPFCKQFQPVLKNVMSKYLNGKDVAWVYRNFPIDSLHPKARKEAEATECAAEIGGNDGFWKFYDKLFEVTPGNNGLDPAQLSVIAKSVGLDVTKFNACVSSGKYAAKVEASIKSGQKAGVNGTPTTFIISGKDLKSIVGSVPGDQLEVEIQNMLKK